MHCDVLIVGGGVLGTSLAARLSRTRLKVCLAERAADVADGASKGNAGITSSYYAAPGTLAARLTTASVFRWDEVCRRLNVPFRRIGAVMPAMTEPEAAALPELCRDAIACGVRAALLTRDQALELEPLLSPGCLGALHLPDEGIIDPVRLTWALAELAARNGVRIMLGTPVVGFRRSGDRIAAATTPEGEIEARFVVNAAGLQADRVSQLAGGESFRMWPRKGQYWILDRAFGARLRHIVFAAPATETKGIHVVPTTRGSVLLGPTADDGEDRDDKATVSERLQDAFEHARRLVPSVSLDHAIRTYAALRPACDEPFFIRRDARVANLIHTVNRSFGVSASLGSADYVAELLQRDGLEIEPDPQSADELPFLPMLRHTPDPAALSGLPENYSQIICVCEQVGAAEIEAALRARVPARSVEGIWKRTGATGGRCQGALCMAGVLFLCSVHGDVPPDALCQREHGTVGIGDGGSA
jgi:glycerol-3-phosphate dehydrogenase